VVGIALLTLVPGIVGGSETYARELVRSLARVGELEYRVFTPTIAADAADGLPGRVVDAYPASWTIPGRLAAMTRAWVWPGRIRRQLELDHLDAIHFPLTVMLPPVDRPAAVTTVVDVQHEYLPEFFSRAELTYRRFVYPRTLRRSRLLIAISEHTKATVLERLRISPDLVRVIHLGVDLERFSPDGSERLPFLLYPASRWAHKNHERLFEALALLRRDRPELTLVLTGAGHEGTPAPEGVDVRGRVSARELVRLYRTAAAVVFPSLYEGFGQPTLEAMACGCPVASSDAAALPEICGDAARYFNPNSPEAIAEAVEDVLRRPGEFARRGLERVRRFTWGDCARQHEAVYRELGA
jgi:glycosyltransferase involved in cell wall biosynthesis